MSQSQDSGFDKIDFVFLDREGVLNRKPPEGHYVTRWEQFELLPGVESAIAKLNRSGCKVILVTNQRGVALGLCSEADVRTVHSKLCEHLLEHGAHLDAIYFCPHAEGRCNCRKPATGMFEQAFRDFPGSTPANSVMIGDSLSDIEAGQRLGMRTIFIVGNSAHRKPGAERAAALATAKAHSLPDCVERYFCATSSNPAKS